MQRRKRGGSGRGRAGSSSGSGRRSRPSSGSSSGGDADEGEGEDEDGDGDASSSGRRRRRGGRGGGREEDQAEAEKKKIQIVLAVAIPAALLMLIVIGAMASGGSRSSEAETEQPIEQTVKRVEVKQTVLDEMRKLSDEGTDDFKAAQELEGPGKLTKLESAKRKLEQALDVAKTARDRVAENNRGESWNRLDSIEEGIVRTLISVRKQVLEAKSSGG